MKVWYTNPAAADLADVLDYVVAKSPLGARRVQKRLRAIERLLTQFPMTGEVTRLPWLRRITTVPLNPYVVFYEVTEDAIVIHAVRHSARDPSSMPGQS